MGRGSGDKKSASFVYILNKDYAWHPATLEKTEGTKAHVSVPQYPDEKSIASDGGRAAKKRENQVVDLKHYPNQVLPLQNVDSNGDLIEFPDMVELPYLHEAGILYNLKLRHMKGKPYTRTGDIVIAINPFQWFTELYTEQVRAKYANKIVWTDSGETDPRASLEPHVYETSAMSYKGLAFEGVDQSILVSGESGAGKTETVKIAMNHMASVQRGPTAAKDANFEDPVVTRVLQSNPLLESFGNAKTTRNDNSSRFGKYIQLQFDVSERNTNMIDRSKSTCKLAGSKCEAYLLEKNRITGHESAERTYHIFYQILSAPEAQKKEFWPKLAGTNLDSFKYVGKTDTLQIEKRTDAQWFEGTCQTLELINLGGDKLKTLMRAIIAVMQCGNLTFGKLGGDADKSECTSKKELADLAELMGVGEGDLNLAFTERTMKTRNETYKVPLNVEAAKNSCDAFAKEVYGKLFLWLVDGINEATRAENNYGKDVGEFGIIGLLDIFGFESFVINRFEQLCINYANEKLQQKFTEDIFRSVQAEYEAEGIELAEITYDDNTDVLDLIEGRTGLCAMLNEECVRPKGSDEAFVQKALSANKKSPCMIVNNMDRMSFGIHHYAGKVMYSAEFFVERNQDTLPTDLEDVMFKSSNFIIAKKPEEPDAGGGGKGPKRQKSNIVGSTIWTKYKAQLTTLMTDLRKTSSRYIRCIKPNRAKVPVVMEHMGTVEQLRCAGVVAAVTITRSAFPNRLENQVARYRYNTMWDKSKYPTTATDSDPPDVKLSKDCDALMTCALKEKEANGKKAFVVGKTRTYFRAGALEYLESNRSAGMDGQAKQIQALVRGHLARKKFGDMRGKKDEDARKAKEEEERKKRQAEEAKKKAEREKIAAEKAEMARKKAEAEKKAAEEAKKKAEAERKKREKAEQEAREKEEKEKQKALKKTKKEIDKLKEDVAKKQKDNEKLVKKAEEKCKAAEKERDEYLNKYEDQMREASKIDKGELQAMQKKVAESDKIIAYLKKENEKTRNRTRDMETDIEELKETNQRLVEASASAGASLDSLEKQRARIGDHNAKLEDNLGKYKDQNKQLKKDLDNRQAYFEAEKKIKEDYEKAMEKIVEMMEDKCDDSTLVEKVMTAQLTCTTNNLNRLSGGNFPGLL